MSNCRLYGKAPHEVFVPEHATIDGHFYVNHEIE